MKIDAIKLSRAIGRVSHLASSRTTLPILNMAHLSATGGILSIKATDLDAHAIARVECNGDFDPICVSASRLQILANAARGEAAIELGNGGVKFTSEGLICMLPVMDAKDYPAYPTGLKPVEVNCGDLANGIRRVAWACSDDPTRYGLHPAWITLTPKSILAWASDGRACAVFEMASIASPAKGNIIQKYANNLCDMLDEDGAVLKLSENYIGASSEFGEMAVKKVESNESNFRAIYSGKKFSPLGTVNRVEALDALLLAKSLMPGKAVHDPVVLGFESDGLKISGDNYERFIPGSFKPGSFKIDANLAGMALKSMTGDAPNIGAGQSEGIRLVDGDVDIMIAGMRTD